MMRLDRRDDIVTTGIATAVAVSVVCKWIGSSVFFKLTAEPVR
jgi:hypothetical protein